MTLLRSMPFCSMVRVIFRVAWSSLSERLISVCSGDLHMRKSFSPKEANHHGDYVQIPRALLLPIQH
uniref:Uncharacterized protein n=1 Tax=Escherichia coli TaxID=562 RepID=Q6KDC6_ECOLX|nr:hypothetical protein [Escherichia coli Nissle 1917]